MKVDGIDLEAAVAEVKKLLNQEQSLSPAFKAAINVLLLLVSTLFKQVTLNSNNSSKPPSSDPNRQKKKKNKSNNKPGGQKGHQGTTLSKVEDPDLIETIEIDQSTLPAGHYKHVGYETRQVIDIDISSVVTEYRAQILENETGQQFVAAFPNQVTRPVQYGNNLKAHAVYLSQYQLLPYNRIQEYFADQLNIPLSQGSLYNFNQEASDQLDTAGFEAIVKNKLCQATLLHGDETGINVDGKRHWLHCASNKEWSYFFPHAKRGSEAMNEAAIFPHFKGVLCHDHYKSYYTYNCTHALCNAHHLRELERAWEQDGQQWANTLQQLLKTINIAVDQAGGQLTSKEANRYKQKYRAILKKAEVESPPPDESQRKQGQRGRLKRSKARNLLERLIHYEEDVLRFMETAYVPFTNNLAENDIRMTKVQQKISGCFRSMEGAQLFCKIRSYISTCRKQQVSASEALSLLFKSQLPEFFDN